MKNRIHIFGASGSGASTIAKSRPIPERLQFWILNFNTTYVGLPL